MKKGKIILLTIIGICLIISLVLGISYSLWSLRVTQTDSNNVVADCFNITFTESNNILLQNTYPIHDDEGKSLTPYTFTIKNNCSSYADYEVQLEILNTSTLDEQYLKIMVDDNDPVLMNTLEVGEPKESNTKIAYTLDKGFIDKNEEKTYNLRVWLADFVTTETEGVQNSKWSAKVTLKASYRNTEPTYCELNPNIATCEILAKGETEELLYDGTIDNNLRYVGSDPNNYVSFNDELWRIIGVMNNIDDGTGKMETRLKIIKDEPYSRSIAWDTNGNNNWLTSSLQQELNNTYYNSINLADQNLIGETLWNLGGSKDAINILTSSFYEIERGQEINENSQAEWVGKIGLVYPSDYGYATIGGSITTRDMCLEIDLYHWSYGDVMYPDCYNNDWLYDNTSWQWTLTSVTSNMQNAFYIGHKGDIRYNLTEYPTIAYPVFYLKSEVKFSGGNGTKENPYQLSL